MTAPLWGRVSMPPLAIDATRCSTSSGICAAFAAWINVSDIAARAMLMPQGIGNRLQGIGDDGEPRQCGDDAAETVFRRRVHRSQQRPRDRGFGSVSKLGHDRL